MLEDIRRQLHLHVGRPIELETKQSKMIAGELIWLSPDRTMAEIAMGDGEIKTITDIQIKRILSH